jgi:hypothetical protein
MQEFAVSAKGVRVGDNFTIGKRAKVEQEAAT